MTTNCINLPEFHPFQKIPRLNREIVITEKIHGTNAQVHVYKDKSTGIVRALAGSRNRWIFPDDDNYGFAKWVSDNEEVLCKVLGEGTHFGEWWGSGIQHGYGFKNGERFFSLFNVRRWNEENLKELQGIGVRTVPIIYCGMFSETAIKEALSSLQTAGSRVAPNFMDPEGIVVYHTASNQCFKVTLKGDEEPKKKPRDEHGNEI